MKRTVFVVCLILVSLVWGGEGVVMGFQKLRDIKKVGPFYTQQGIESAIREALIQARQEWQQWGPVGEQPTVPVGMRADNAYCYRVRLAREGDYHGILGKDRSEKLCPDDVKLARKICEGLDLGFDVGEDIDRRIDVNELWDIQDACFNKHELDPNFRGIINNLVFFTIGRGVRFECLNPLVNSHIWRFWNDNDMEQRQEEMVRCFGVEGEYFMRAFLNENTGEVRIRKAPPKRVDPIETDPDDIETILAYNYQYATGGKAEWIADANYFNQRDGFMGVNSKHKLDWARRMLFIKNGFYDELRGRPPYHSALRPLKYLEDFITDRATFHHERCRVIMIKEISRQSGRDYKSLENSTFAMPSGGHVLHAIYDGDRSRPIVDWRFETPKLESKEAEADFTAIAHTVAAGVNMPLFVWQQRGDVQVYASIKKQDMPFSQGILFNQDKFEQVFDSMFRLSLECAVKAFEATGGKAGLPAEIDIPKFATEESATSEALSRIDMNVLESKGWESVVRDVLTTVKEEQVPVKCQTVRAPINIIFPAIIQENPKETAEYLKTVYEIGSDIGLRPMSMQMISAKLGVNFRRASADQMAVTDMLKDMAGDPDRDYDSGKTNVVPGLGNV